MNTEVSYTVFCLFRIRPISSPRKNSFFAFVVVDILIL